MTSFIARYFLKSNHRDRFFSWTSFLSIAGISIGVATMIVVLSVIDSFEKELRSSFLAANAHILLYRFPYGIKNVSKWEKLLTTRYSKAIKETSPFIYYETMAQKAGTMHLIAIKGILPKKRQNVQNISNIVKPLSSLTLLQQEIEHLNPHEKFLNIILGKGLAEKLEVMTGGFIEIFAPGKKEHLGKFLHFKVVGIYNSGLNHYDDKLGMISLYAAKKLFNMQNRVTGIEVGLKKPYTSQKIARDMKKNYDLQVKEWQTFNGPLFEVLKIEKTVIGFIVFLVAFVAVFNILTTMFIIVNQKQRQISLLKSMGANNKQILTIFLKQGLYIGVIGGIFGMILAAILSLFLKNYQFMLIDLPKEYFLSKLPVVFDVKLYLMIFIINIINCVLAVIYPSWVATKITPTLGIRQRQ